MEPMELKPRVRAGVGRHYFLPPELDRKLMVIARRERRSITSQVVHMLEGLVARYEEEAAAS
jgi:hypothetical protein